MYEYLLCIMMKNESSVTELKFKHQKKGIRTDDLFVISRIIGNEMVNICEVEKEGGGSFRWNPSDIVYQDITPLDQSGEHEGER